MNRRPATVELQLSRRRATVTQPSSATQPHRIPNPAPPHVRRASPLGIDVGSRMGSFAAAMKLRNVTVVTTTMSVDALYSEAVALRGLVPLHVML